MLYSKQTPRVSLSVTHIPVCVKISVIEVKEFKVKFKNETSGYLPCTTQVFHLVKLVLFNYGIEPAVAF